MARPTTFRMRPCFAPSIQPKQWWFMPTPIHLTDTRLFLDVLIMHGPINILSTLLPVAMVQVVLGQAGSLAILAPWVPHGYFLKNPLSKKRYPFSALANCGAAM